MTSKRGCDDSGTPTDKISPIPVKKSVFSQCRRLGLAKRKVFSPANEDTTPNASSKSMQSSPQSRRISAPLETTPVMTKPVMRVKPITRSPPRETHDETDSIEYQGNSSNSNRTVTSNSPTVNQQCNLTFVDIFNIQNNQNLSTTPFHTSNLQINTNRTKISSASSNDDISTVKSSTICDKGKSIIKSSKIHAVPPNNDIYSAPSTSKSPKRFERNITKPSKTNISPNKAKHLAPSTSKLVETYNKEKLAPKNLKLNTGLPNTINPTPSTSTSISGSYQNHKSGLFKKDKLDKFVSKSVVNDINDKPKIHETSKKNKTLEECGKNKKDKSLSSKMTHKTSHDNHKFRERYIINGVVSPNSKYDNLRIKIKRLNVTHSPVNLKNTNFESDIFDYIDKTNVQLPLTQIKTNEEADTLAVEKNKSKKCNYNENKNDNETNIQTSLHIELMQSPNQVISKIKDKINIMTDADYIVENKKLKNNFSDQNFNFKPNEEMYIKNKQIRATDEINAFTNKNEKANQQNNIRKYKATKRRSQRLKIHEKNTIQDTETIKINDLTGFKVNVYDNINIKKEKHNFPSEIEATYKVTSQKEDINCNDDFEIHNTIINNFNVNELIKYTSPMPEIMPKKQKVQDNENITAVSDSNLQFENGIINKHLRKDVGDNMLKINGKQKHKRDPNMCEDIETNKTTTQLVEKFLCGKRKSCETEYEVAALNENPLILKSKKSRRKQVMDYSEYLSSEDSIDIIQKPIRKKGRPRKNEPLYLNSTKNIEEKILKESKQKKEKRRSLFCRNKNKNYIDKCENSLSLSWRLNKQKNKDKRLYPKRKNSKSFRTELLNNSTKDNNEKMSIYTFKEDSNENLSLEEMRMKRKLDGNKMLKTISNVSISSKTNEYDGDNQPSVANVNNEVLNNVLKESYSAHNCEPNMIEVNTLNELRMSKNLNNIQENHDVINGHILNQSSTSENRNIEILNMEESQDSVNFNRPSTTSNTDEVQNRVIDNTQDGSLFIANSPIVHGSIDEFSNFENEYYARQHINNDISLHASSNHENDILPEISNNEITSTTEDLHLYVYTDTVTFMDNDLQGMSIYLPDEESYEPERLLIDEVGEVEQELDVTDNNLCVYIPEDNYAETKLRTLNDIMVKYNFIVDTLLTRANNEVVFEQEYIMRNDGLENVSQPIQNIVSTNEVDSESNESLIANNNRQISEDERKVSTTCMFSENESDSNSNLIPPQSREHLSRNIENVEERSDNNENDNEMVQIENNRRSGKVIKTRHLRSKSSLCDVNNTLNYIRNVKSAPNLSLAKLLKIRDTYANEQEITINIGTIPKFKINGKNSPINNDTSSNSLNNKKNSDKTMDDNDNKDKNKKRKGSKPIKLLGKLCDIVKNSSIPHISKHSKVGRNKVIEKVTETIVNYNGEKMDEGNVNNKINLIENNELTGKQMENTVSNADYSICEYERNVDSSINNGMILQSKHFKEKLNSEINTDWSKPIIKSPVQIVKPMLQIADIQENEMGEVGIMKNKSKIMNYISDFTRTYDDADNKTNLLFNNGVTSKIKRYQTKIESDKCNIIHNINAQEDKTTEEETVQSNEMESRLMGETCNDLRKITEYKINRNGKLIALQLNFNTLHYIKIRNVDYSVKNTDTSTVCNTIVNQQTKNDKITDEVNILNIKKAMEVEQKTNKNQEETQSFQKSTIEFKDKDEQKNLNPVVVYKHKHENGQVTIHKEIKESKSLIKCRQSYLTKKDIESIFDPVVQNSQDYLKKQSLPVFPFTIEGRKEYYKYCLDEIKRIEQINKDKLETLKQLHMSLYYNQNDRLTKLKEVNLKMKQSIQNGLVDLARDAKQMSTQPFNMKTLLKNLKIQTNLVGYSENIDCFSLYDVHQ